MYQKDYILRLIQEFSRFLAIILGLKESGKYEESLEMIDKTCKGLLKIDMHDLAPGNGKLEGLLQNDAFNDEQLEILASLFQVKAEIFRETGQVFSAITHFEHAYVLYQFCNDRSTTYSMARIDAMDTIQLQLDQMRETE
jgi:hypothetical protein